MKYNMTYRITKCYNDGFQWTDRVVGKQAYDKYMDLLLENIVKLRNEAEDGDRFITALMTTVEGKVSDDIDNKEEINRKTFYNVKNNDLRLLDKSETESNFEEE